MKPDHGINPRTAAIICSHVAVHRLPIQRAKRDIDDGGWQFLCGGDGHDDTDAAQVWGLGEVLDRDPSLAPFLALPPGTVVHRASARHPWIVGSSDC